MRENYSMLGISHQGNKLRGVISKSGGALKTISMGGPSISRREIRAVSRVLKSGQLAQGQEVAAFEAEFSISAVGSRAVVAVNSGTSALHIGNLALGLGPGDEVIVPSFTFAASANSVALTGATPVFCDIDRTTFTIDTKSISALITPRTRAIMAVHLYGQLADMHEIVRIAKEHNLFVIEDAAQAHLASYEGLLAGEWGDYAAFSFYPTKNMTTGEGGALVTANPQLERTARLLRNQGMLERYKNELAGLNNRMTNIAAAIGREQLRKLEHFTKLRERNAAYLNEELADLDGVSVPLPKANSRHVYHQYTITVSGDRDAFAQELKARGVETGVYYPKPVNELPAYSQVLDLPNAQWVSSHCVSLPIHPKLSRSQLKRIASAVRGVFK